jgi:hypothetical protein
MNWDFNHLRFYMALNVSMASLLVYGPFAIITHQPKMIPWLASMFFMLGWLIA